MKTMADETPYSQYPRETRTSQGKPLRSLRLTIPSVTFWHLSVKAPKTCHPIRSQKFRPPEPLRHDRGATVVIDTALRVSQDSSYDTSDMG
jgi:hypothetical protein